MHFDGYRKKAKVTVEEISKVFTENPLNYQTLVNIISDGVNLIFIDFYDEESGKISGGGGRLVVVIEGDALIFIHSKFSFSKMEEVIYHEFLHLHLRRIWGRHIYDQEGQIHELIIEEGQRLADNPLTSFRNLVGLCDGVNKRASF